ncbi:Multidrug resistance-associated protein 4 [Trachymyrmex septentrionalis]|uniref:Multidrug resistance-associated protein 4 n=1 Tax=Trachymyrmex septentrionalis TaxID=34720 RepID=A0A151K3N7_9HYME|nr:Multidrug resistance-associated protein 4 [Trachymyrmex septentrionalis]
MTANIWISFTSSVKQNTLFTSYLYYDCGNERKINLSEGQFVKINLAQATYKDTYLLDDPFFVDPHVSRYLVDMCICSI